MKEALRKIEEALETAKLLALQGDGLGAANQLSVIAIPNFASLRSLLEGDTGEDAKKLSHIRDALNSGHLYMRNFGTSENQDAHMVEALKFVEYFRAKAKVGEAEIREAKREVLMEIHDLVYASFDLEDVKRRLIELESRYAAREAIAKALKEGR